MHFERLRRTLQQTLRGENVFHFAGADTEGKSAESAVGRGVAVTADDGHAGLREAQFRSDDVHDALVFGVNAVVRNAELFAVLIELRDLVGRDGIEDRQRAIGGGNAVIRGGHGQIGPADFETAGAQAGKGLGRSDFVDQMQIDIEQGRGACFFPYEVRVPDLLGQSSYRA